MTLLVLPLGHPSCLAADCPSDLPIPPSQPSFFLLALSLREGGAGVGLLANPRRLPRDTLLSTRLWADHPTSDTTPHFPSCRYRLYHSRASHYRFRAQALVTPHPAFLAKLKKAASLNFFSSHLFPDFMSGSCPPFNALCIERDEQALGHWVPSLA